MANPLMSSPQNNMIQQLFQQFKSTFQGDPKATVQQLLNSGRMTQDQFNYLQQMANGLRNILH
ncbi:MAG: hypothetical protein J6U54_22760 [Clostridiales bacterium]|nr:hypothetical protein [Clostridiales bacterium]